MSEKRRGRPKKGEDEILQTCTVRLKPEIIAELKDLSEKTDRSVANTMRRIIETFIADYKKRENVDADEEKDNPSDYILMGPGSRIELSSDNTHTGLTERRTIHRG